MKCLEAQMNIRDLPPETKIRSPEHLETLEHYASCTHCRPLGLGPIRRMRMSCEEAVALALRGRHLVFDPSYCETIREVVAHEHIYGTPVLNAGGQMVSTHFCGVIGNGCAHEVCSFARNLWFSAPLSAHYDGDDEKNHGAEWTIDAARKAGWDLKPLLASVHERLKSLMTDICSPATARLRGPLEESEQEARHLRELLSDHGQLVLS